MLVGMPIMPSPRRTAAYYLQSVISFALALGSVLLGVAFLPADAWTRAFLAVGVLYLATATFTLAKCVRDQHEAHSVLHRVDEARLERLIHEHDPLRAAV